MQPIAWIYTTFLLLLSQPTQETLNPTPQIVLQCGMDPFKCAGLTNSSTWPCCCFETDKIGCNARIDCKYNIDYAKCQVLLTIHPTLFPTDNPTVIPTINPTLSPTITPTQQTLNPTINPTQSTSHPTTLPTYPPTIIPTINPTHNPSYIPSINPTSIPTTDPTFFPTENPSNFPTIYPTYFPSNIPTFNPTFTLTPTINPTYFPSNIPTFHPAATLNPTYIPTINPTSNPTYIPTINPTYFPTLIPTYNPTDIPTSIPTHIPSNLPTVSPTYIPSNNPSISPTNMPSIHPVNSPTTQCKECEIYNLTLTNIDANLSIRECETETKPIENNCECTNGMISLTIKYIGNNIASKIEIIYQDNIVLCSFTNISPNTQSICNIKTVSNYIKFGAITRFKIYYTGNNNHRYCVGEYDTSGTTYMLGYVDTNCPYLMLNGWTDYVGNVCFNDNVDIKYWNKRSGSSDSSNHKTKKNKKRKSYGSSDGASSDSSRRRRLGNGISTKCIWNKDDNKYLWYKNTDNGCTGKWNSNINRRRNLLWGNYYGSSDSDDSNDEQWKILHKVCLTYDIGILRENCSTLESIFLPLCENNKTSFNSSSVSTDDITDLIVKYIPQDGILPFGYRDNDTLGILVNIISGNVNEFELCLGNVTIDLNMSVNYTQDAIDIADRVTFVIDNESSICYSDGLPCLNFYFKEQCPTTTAKMNKNCDCNGRGLQSITFLYSGDQLVDKIEVFRRGKLLCIFNNVSNGDIIVCNQAFRRRTYLKITYSNNNDICDDIFRTDCSLDILGATVCDANLIVIEWIDKTGVLCDETVSDSEIFRHNALIHDKYDIMNNTLHVFDKLDVYVKWALIGIMIMFVVLMCIGFNICVFGRFYHKNIGFQSKKESQHKKLPSSSIVKHVHDMYEMENTKRIIYTENDDYGIREHRRHKSINLDEEEVVNNIYDIEEEVEEEYQQYETTTATTICHHKHKSINFNEEQYLTMIGYDDQSYDSKNNEDHSDDTVKYDACCYLEESDIDSTML